jgi:hypothetical protein
VGHRRRRAWVLGESAGWIKDKADQSYKRKNENTPFTVHCDSLVFKFYASLDTIPKIKYPHYLKMILTIIVAPLNKNK